MIRIKFIKTFRNKIQIKKSKVLIVFDDIIAGMLINKTLNPLVTELIIKGRKRNIYLFFITQIYFDVLKNIRINSEDCFIIKILNKSSAKELQKIPFNQSLVIEFKNFINLYKKCTVKEYYFLLIHTSLALDIPLRYR